MVYPELNREERHKKVLGVWKALSGGPDAPIGYDDATYKSESGTADRNWCLAYVYESPPSSTVRVVGNSRILVIILGMERLASVISSRYTSTLPLPTYADVSALH